VWASKFSVLCLLSYVVLMHFASTKDAWFIEYLGRLRIDAEIAADFMLLWVGTFVGVCLLSYAIRTHEVTVAALTRTDEDHLMPQIRLVLTGALATLLAVIAMIDLGDVAIGSAKLSQIVTKATLAFLLGAMFGISEQKLSKTVLKRVDNIIGGATK
jgi:type IV secretory pathway VirB2 component (pilin)